MIRDSFRHVIQTKTSIANSAAQIHILKPHREEVFVEAAKLYPDLTAQHKKCPGWLLGHVTRKIIPIQAAVTPVYRIVPINPVKQEYFQS
jgi:hypothetical protein